MKIALTALTVAAVLFASSVSAFDPADLQRLKATNECANCDLSGANLEGAFLAGAFLKGANLSWAKMRGVILCNTTMPDGSVIYSGC